MRPFAMQHLIDVQPNLCRIANIDAWRCAPLGPQRRTANVRRRPAKCWVLVVVVEGASLVEGGIWGAT